MLRTGSCQSVLPTPGRTVLLGWELGGGLGHLYRLLPLARALAAEGLRPVLAIKNPTEYQDVLASVPFPVAAAPQYRGSASIDAHRFVAASFADILAIRGWATVEGLLPLVEGWDRLIEQYQPTLVVGDFSPTLCLAAYGRLPTVLIGDGFTVPPADGPRFPPLVFGQEPVLPEERLLAVVQAVQQLRGQLAPKSLPGLFSKAERFACTYPELDPYQSWRTEPMLGPLDGVAFDVASCPPAENERGKAGYFAYLGADLVALPHILGGLAGSSHPGTVYLRGADHGLRDHWRGKGLRVLDVPASQAEMFRRGNVVVHAGGVGLAQQALAAGRPQLCLPQHLEQLLNSQLLERLGVGRHLVGDFSEGDVARALELVCSQPRFTERARAHAERLRAHGPWNPLPGIVQRCLALVNSKQPQSFSNEICTHEPSLASLA